MPKRIDPKRCILCGVCLPVCPNQGIKFDQYGYYIRMGICTDCYGHSPDARCETVCPTNAVEEDPLEPHGDAACAERAVDLCPGRFPRD